MERCQEISQCVPTIAEVTAITEHQTYQGIAAADAALVRSAERTDTDAGNGMLPAISVSDSSNYTLPAPAKVPEN